MTAKSTISAKKSFYIIKTAATMDIYSGYIDKKSRYVDKPVIYPFQFASEAVLHPFSQVINLEGKGDNKRDRTKQPTKKPAERNAFKKGKVKFGKENVKL